MATAWKTAEKHASPGQICLVAMYFPKLNHLTRVGVGQWTASGWNILFGADDTNVGVTFIVYAWEPLESAPARNKLCERFSERLDSEAQAKTERMRRKTDHRPPPLRPTRGVFAGGDS